MPEASGLVDQVVEIGVVGLVEDLVGVQRIDEFMDQIKAGLAGSPENQTILAEQAAMTR